MTKQRTPGQQIRHSALVSGLAILAVTILVIYAIWHKWTGW